MTNPLLRRRATKGGETGNPPRCNLRPGWATIPYTQKHEGTRQIVALKQNLAYNFPSHMIPAELLTSRTALQGLVSLVFGVLILMFPKILNYLVAFYFILTGLSAILPFLR